MFSQTLSIQLLTRIGAGISLIVSTLSLMMLPAEKAQASFTCGPNLLTYQVRSLSGSSGAGVRCVKLRLSQNVGPYQVRTLYWYGEGYWGQQKYRHIGTFDEKVSSPKGDNSVAFDIFGNGESFNGSLTELKMTLTPPLPKTPQTIEVTGAWHEVWTLVGGNTVQGYTSALGPVRNCGSNFQTYHVRGGNGILCIQREYGLWYGEGSWSGKTYGHIGVDSGSQAPGMSAEAVDICEPSRFNFCKFASPLYINPHLQEGPPFPYVPITVTGTWNETWEPH